MGVYRYRPRCCNVVKAYLEIVSTHFALYAWTRLQAFGCCAAQLVLSFHTFAAPVHASGNLNLRVGSKSTGLLSRLPSTKRKPRQRSLLNLLTTHQNITMTYTRLGRDTHPAPHSGLNLNDPPPQPNPIWRALNRASYINSSTRSPLRPRAVSRLSGATTTTTTSTASTTRRTWSPSPVRTLKRRPGSRTISISSSTFSSPFPQLGQPRASSPAPSPPPSTRRRRPKSKGYDDEDEYDGDDDIDRLAFPKFGGGVDAFRSGEKRIGGLDDGEDTWEVSADGSVRIIVKRGGRWGTKRGRWNRFKWALFVANTVVCVFFRCPF